MGGILNGILGRVAIGIVRRRRLRWLTAPPIPSSSSAPHPPAPSLGRKAVAGILDAVRRERDGEDADRLLVRALLQIHHDLNNLDRAGSDDSSAKHTAQPSPSLNPGSSKTVSLLRSRHPLAQGVAAAAGASPAEPAAGAGGEAGGGVGAGVWGGCTWGCMSGP